MHNRFLSLACSFSPPTSIYLVSFASSYALAPHIIHPSLALLGQLSCPQGHDAGVVLEVVGVETEEIEQSGYVRDAHIVSNDNKRTARPQAQS